MEGGYDAAAITHFKEALEMDPDAWLPKEGLARVYGGQGLYSDAISLMQDACDCIPRNFEHLGGYLLPWIAIWKREIGDCVGAYRAAREGHIADPSSLLAQYIFLEALYQEGFSNDVVEMLKHLAGCWSLEKSMSWLTRLLLQNCYYPVFVYLGHAFQTTGNLPFIFAELEKLLDVVSKSRDEYSKVALHGQVALFKYEYDNQVESSIQLLEQALKMDKISNTLSIYQKHGEKKVFEHTLAQLYFDSAVRAKKEGKNPSPITRKLKKMATVTSSTTENTDDAFEFWGAGYASMLWGRWRREYEAAQAADWRKCFRARILEELKLLDDDDPTNDMQGLHTLAITLLHVDDSINAAAILAILFKPVEDERAASVKTKDDEKNLEVAQKQRIVPTAESDEAGKHSNVEESTVEDLKKSDEGAQHNGNEGRQDITVPYFAKLARCVALPDEGGIQDPENRPLLPTFKQLPSSPTTTTEPSTHTTSADSKPLRTKLRKLSSPGSPEPAATPTIINNNNNTSSSSTKVDGRLTLNLSSAWIHECDGPCDTGFRDYDELYVCKICFGKKFCGACLEAVKARTLVRRDCCPDHEWYRAWPIPEPKWRDVAEEVREGRLVMRPEWLERVRGEWL